MEQKRNKEEEKMPNMAGVPKTWLQMEQKALYRQHHPTVYAIEIHEI
jgi:hypothetical protein